VRLVQVTSEAQKAQRLRREADERMRVSADAARRDVALQQRRTQDTAARERAGQQEVARRQAAVGQEAMRVREEREQRVAEETERKAKVQAEARQVDEARRRAEAGRKQKAAELKAEEERAQAKAKAAQEAAARDKVAAKTRETEMMKKAEAETEAREAAKRIRVVEDHACKAAVVRKALLASTPGVGGFKTLPSRKETEEPQTLMLLALTAPLTAVAAPAVEKGPCDRCDGPHHADDCPHFRKVRDEHKDAWDKYDKEKTSDASGEPCTGSVQSNEGGYPDGSSELELVTTSHQLGCRFLPTNTHAPNPSYRLQHRRVPHITSNS
jgi:hypothetical protein